MTMLKVIEVLAESDKSWEDAAQQAVSKIRQDGAQREIDLHRKFRGDGR